MPWLRLVFVFGVLAVTLINVRTTCAEGRNKLKAAMLPYVVECRADFGVTEEEIKKAKESGSLGTIDPCFLGCIFKKAKLIDDEGLFDVDKAEEMTKKYFTDEADQKKALDIVSNCKAVNEHEVTDEKEGCERAGFLFKCFMPFKKTFANKIDDSKN